MGKDGKTTEKIFTSYQVFVIAILSLLQFTVILDFMVLQPLGVILMDKLHVTPSQFGLVVSVYAFSAGGAGLLTAGFADKFDRKKLLMFFYTGFILGTVLCAIAPSYQLLLGARIITGIFGGVIGSVSFAIITDLFKMEVRGRVMGFVQMSFAASQVLGIPIGLVLANQFNWHAPFWMIAGAGTILGVLMAVKLKPVDKHLHLKTEHNAFQHLLATISRPDYAKAFFATTLLATGGFMLMPFGSAYSINNLGITLEQLPYVYLITGVFSIIFGPIIGKLSDKIGKFNIFCMGACSKSSDGVSNAGSIAGGSANFTVDLGTQLIAIGSSFASNGVLIARLAAGNTPASFVAVQQACTHQGTSINFVSSNHTFLCPNHGAEFSTTGANVGGQSTSALKVYSISITGTIMTVAG